MSQPSARTASVTALIGPHPAPAASVLRVGAQGV